MNNIIALKTLELTREATLIYGQVEETCDGTYGIRLKNGDLLTAQRARGCLLAPAPGDVVLIADDGERAFVLSVLIGGEERGRIVLPETCELEGGEITVSGRSNLALEAPRVSMNGIQGEARFERLSLLARWCDFRARKIVAVAEVWDRVVGRLTERIRDSYRCIENTEQTTAGRIRTLVRGRFSIGAKNAAVTAEEDVTLDGRKIHLG